MGVLVEPKVNLHCTHIRRFLLLTHVETLNFCTFNRVHFCFVLLEIFILI